MWRVMREVFNGDGVQISGEIQADNMTGREAAEMAQQLTHFEDEAPTYDDGVTVQYVPVLVRA